MRWCVLVLAVGEISYAPDSRRVLDDYFSRHGIEAHFITEIPDLDLRKSHPSWWKLLAHKILPGYDFILCWDLDLLPRTPHVSILEDLDMTKLCLAWDWAALCFPTKKFRPSFKYNGGLIGYPASARPFLEGLFEAHAPGEFPSYEQYYLNDAIEEASYPVHELPKDVNVHFSFNEFRRARLQHYTYKQEAKRHIKAHVDRYFGTDEWILKTVGPFTMLSEKRLLANLNAIRQVDSIPGDVVEIGVWKGGSMLAMLLAYDHTNKTDRVFHLYDTFAGLTPPSAVDTAYTGDTASYLLKHNPDARCEATLAETQANVFSTTQYPRKKIQFHRGDIRTETTAPERIAVLRLDTDFYDSTKHELELFYDRVAPGGVVLIDDYGHWMGCRKAVDEWLVKHPEITLQSIDETGVFFVKP